MIALDVEPAKCQGMVGLVILIAAERTPQSESATFPAGLMAEGGSWDDLIVAGHATLPEGITHLPAGAFRGSSLVSVTCPSTLVSIGPGAFFDCSRLVSITLPDRLVSIGDYAFCFCSALASLCLPAGLLSIGHEAFHDCSSLPAIAIPASLTSLGDGAFHLCSSLAAVALPASLKSVPDGAFSGCSSLARVSFAESLASIGNEAFANCPALTQVTLPAATESPSNALPTTTTITRLSSSSWHAEQRIRYLGRGVLAYKRCRPLLYGWLERAQLRLGAYGPNGVARKRDRDEFDRDFGCLCTPLAATRLSRIEQLHHVHA